LVDADGFEPARSSGCGAPSQRPGQRAASRRAWRGRRWRRQGTRGAGRRAETRYRGARLGPVRQSAAQRQDLERWRRLCRGSIQLADPGIHADGKYVTQAFINRAGPSGGSVAGFAFSQDPQQQFLYAADYGNSHVVVLNRKALEILYQFGTRSATPGDFQGPHHIASDSKGNLYVAEVAPGNRAQRFLFKGISATPPPNSLTQAQLAVAQ
jgi:hypothetical protein